MMHLIRLFVLTLLVGMVACSPTPNVKQNEDTAPPVADSTEVGATPSADSNAKNATMSSTKPFFRGMGNEPGWLVDLYADRIFFVTNYGADTLVGTINASVGNKVINATVKNASRTENLKVEIKDEACQDDAGVAFEKTVIVTFGAETLRGSWPPTQSVIFST